MIETALPLLLGRRSRNMLDKRQRVFAAALSLFEERGFGGVTTQAVSERADIAVGTLFRYAPTKNDLLLMVYNERLREALACGAEDARAKADPVAAIMALVTPMVVQGSAKAENVQVYQRELLFGAPGEPHRAEGLKLIADLQAAILVRLMAATGRADGETEDAARLAAISIFAAAHLIISRGSTGAHAEHDPITDLHGQIRQIVCGFLATRNNPEDNWQAFASGEG